MNSINIKEGDKKILFISPVFFGYYKEIISELKKMGFNVTFFADAPSNSNFSKAIGRISKKFLTINSWYYYKKNIYPIILNRDFDYVFIIGGMTFALKPSMIDEIRTYNPNAKFILYQWDSERNLPYSKQIHKYFDKIYSFDMIDCQTNDIYKFLPLFYTEMFENLGKQENCEFKYDCSYIGTAHPKKFHDINAMAEALKKIFPNQFIYHYMPSKLKFVYHKILAPEFSKARYSDFMTNKLSFDQVLDIIKKSKCILDAPQEGQSGLTIRTIECLGAKRKLITTNNTVKNFDFYNPDNILVIDDHVDFNLPFFSTSYKPIDNLVYKKYSLKNWLYTVLS